MKVGIQGIQEAQQANEHNIAQMRPTGALGRMVLYVTEMAQRYAVSITHVDTGALRASHRMRVSGLRGEIYIDPSSVNPKSREKPAEYGVEEHERGGTHSFYERTEREGGNSIVETASRMFTRELK